ncbi:hypothetical protein AAFF27_14245 [Xylophilus sp. GW821-FHT01B05]
MFSHCFRACLLGTLAAAAGMAWAQAPQVARPDTPVPPPRYASAFAGQPKGVASTSTDWRAANAAAAAEAGKGTHSAPQQQHKHKEAP